MSQSSTIVDVNETNLPTPTPKRRQKNQNALIYEYSFDAPSPPIVATTKKRKSLPNRSIDEVQVSHTPSKKRKSVHDILIGESEDEQTDVSRTKKSLPKKNAAPKAKKPRKRNEEQQQTLDKLMQKFRRDIADSNKANCLIEDCKSDSITWRPFNLKRHLKQMHSKEYVKLFAEEFDDEKSAQIELFNVVQDAVELITINGMPFSILNSSGMRGFITSRLNALSKSGYKISINRANILEEVEKVSEIVRNRIKAEMAGNLICVMIDICTKGTLSVLGINATYDVNDETVCRSLGIIPMDVRHNAVNIAVMVYDILKDFNVSLEWVFALCSDNAKNTRNSSEVLDLVANSITDSHNDSNEAAAIDDTYLQSDEEEIGEENEAELRKIMDNAHQFDQLISDISKDVILANDKVVMINHINCGTHTLQLAVNDALEDSNTKATFDEAKEICLAMRTQVVLIEFRKLVGKKTLPPIDNVTRWNSRYVMVKK